MVLDGFPNILDDEIIYSTCARFVERQYFLSDKDARVELFGNSNYNIRIQFPNGIGYLASQIPLAYGYSGLHIVQSGTLLPFYTPFYDEMKIDAVIEAMLHAGTTGSQIKLYFPPPQLRYCPRCTIEDKKNGPTYFRRSHQLPGIFVCWKHAEPLLDSGIKTYGLKKFITAEQAIDSTTIPPLGPLNEKQKNLPYKLRLAQDAHWLLGQDSLRVGRSELIAKYQTALKERGWMTSNDHVRMSMLVEKFQDYYPNDFLEELSCEIRTNSRNNWISAMFASSKRSWPAIKHLLLIQFLALSAQEFFDLPNHNSVRSQSHPFGNGPWPCLSPACQFYRNDVINACTISFRSNGQKKSIFTCECGFSYSRFWSSCLDNQRFSYDKVERHGQIWEDKLKELWNSKDSLDDKLKQLGLKSHELYYYYVRQLGLKRNFKKREEENIKTKQANLNSRADKLSHVQSAWLIAQQENPSASISELQELKPNEYVMLLRNDPDWLNQNKPQPRPTSLPRIDWSRLDREVSKKIRALGKELLLYSSNRVSAQMLMRETEPRHNIRRNRKQMPRSDAMLKKYAESHEQYCCRRVLWAEKSFKDEGHRIPSEYEFRLRAGLQSSKSKSYIKAMVSQVMNRFHENQNDVPWPKVDKPK